MLLQTKLCIAAAAGILSHCLIFIRNEHHIQAPQLFRFFLLLSLFLFIGEARLWALSDSGQAAKTSALIVLSYAASLLTSVAVYRAFFHKLRKFPGPIGARVSKFWHVGKLLGRPNFKVLDELHQQYGDFVRTGESLRPARNQQSCSYRELLGPNEISVRSPSAMAEINGPGSRCTKAPFYDLLLPRTSIITTRNKTLHDQRRRIWDYGFGAKALNQYEPQVDHYTFLLTSAISQRLGAPMNVTSWFHYFSFDLMGQLSFGKSFNMLATGEQHFAIDLMRDGLTLLGLFTPTPWLARIGFSIPGVASGWKSMFVWSDAQMRERIDREDDGENNDITSWLINASRENNSLEADRSWLNGDAFGIIIAGSDTTATTLAMLFYHLALDPCQISRIRSELDQLDAKPDARALQTLPHLNGAINETLRLHPPVPSNGLRESPPEGITIASTFIPGSTVLCLPVYSLHRLASCFERPLEFIPERWYSKPELVHDKGAFAPFNQGRFGCVGKNLALMEVRAVTAALLDRYDLEFAPGMGRGEGVERDMGDQFTATPGKLELVFTERVRKSEV